MRDRVNSDTSPRFAQRVAGFTLATHTGPTLAVTSGATAMAMAVGRHWEGAAAVAAAVLAGQCAVGWSNDAIDADRDRQVARVSKPIVKDWITRRQLYVAAVIAIVACVPLSLLSGVREALAHLVAGIAALSYNVGVKATIFSLVPYAVAFGFLPAFVTWGAPDPGWPRPLVMVATAILGIGAHFVNGVADLDDDAATGVRGLPQRCGARRSVEAGSTCLWACAVIAVLVSRHKVVASIIATGVALLALGVVLAGRRQRSRWAWRLAIVAALGCVSIFVWGGVAWTYAH